MSVLNNAKTSNSSLKNLFATAEHEMEIFECMVCCDDVSRATSHFCCPNDDDHTQCIACFAHFVQYTSSQWMTGQAFPLKCPVKECGHEIPEWQIRQILQEVAADVKKIKNVTSDDANNENSNKDDDDGSNEYASVWETYLSAAFKAGFLNDPENVETVCSRCDVFTYLLPANYRERAHFLHTDTWIAEKNSSTIAKLQTQMQERRDAEKERFDIEYLQIRAQEEMQLEHDFSIAMQFTETKEWLLDNMFQEPGSTELTEIPSQLSPEEQNKVKTEFTAKRVALKASFDEKENNDHWKAFKAQQEKGDEKDAEEVQRLKDQFHQEEVTRQERRAAGRPDPHLKTEREYLRLAKERLALMKIELAEVRKASLRLLDREYLSIRDNTKSEALKEMEMKSNARGRFNRATYIVQLGRDAFAQSELAAMEKQETKTAPAPSARVDSTDSGLSPEAQKKEEHDLLRSKLVTQICTFTTTDSTFSVIAGVLIKSARSVKLFHAIRHLQSQDTDTSTQFKKVALYKLYISLSEKDRERLVDATLATLQDEYRELQENAVKRKDRHSDDDTKIDQNLAVDPELLDAMHGIDIALPSLKRQLSEGVCTSMFIECLTDGCGASLCMRCDETIDACDINLHLCKYARKVELYRQLDEILATASSQRCPTCLTPGVKDLECTHIACSCDSAQGKTTWCYVCGENAASFGGHFRVHNDYSLTCYPEEKRCPMYLKYKYGSLFSDARELLRTGDRAACLERFHLHRKLIASAKYKASLDASDQLLFDEMLLMSYPEGLFDVAKVKELRLILDYNTAKVLERREREEIHRRKQSGSVSPSTTNADAVNE